MFSLLKVPMGPYALSGCDTTKRINRFLQRVGEAPVIFDTVKAHRSGESMLTAMNNLGYLQAQVNQKRTIKGKKVKLSYEIIPGGRYRVRNIRYFVEDSVVERIVREQAGLSSLQPGMPFDLNMLDAERGRISSSLQNSGYYKFNTDYVRFEADTCVGNRLVDLALANNPDYLKAAININKELYNLNLATSDLFPTLSGGMNASGQRQISTSDNFASNFSGETGLSYEADLYGKIRDLQDAQKFEYEATVMDKESARLSLINSVVDLYFNLEYLQNSKDVTKENIKNYENILKITETKYKSGKIDNLEYLQTKQSLLSEQNRLLEIETQFKEMETSLKNILNLRQEEALNIQFGNILLQENLGVNLDVPVAVLANRPDLLASQYRLEKAFKNLQAENKNWYPNVSLNGLLGTSSDKARTTFDFPYLLGSVSVDLPFLDWNRVENKVKISEADYEITAIDFKDTLNQAVNEVAYYSAAYGYANNILENTQKNYQNSQQITKYYQERYNTGKVEFKDYLEAVYTENSLRKDLISQKYQTIKYENYVYKAMAGKY